jgi:hypothetical protein
MSHVAMVTVRNRLHAACMYKLAVQCVANTVLQVPRHAVNAIMLGPACRSAGTVLLSAGMVLLLCAADGASCKL